MGGKTAKNIDGCAKTEREPFPGAGERETTTRGDKVDKRDFRGEKGLCGTRKK